jgi:Tetratricopeptide repeat
MTARHAQATALHLAGRLPDALAAFIAVATQRSRLLGPAHPDSLASRVGLALARADSGDAAAAVPGLTAALEDAEQSVGLRAGPRAGPGAGRGRALVAVRSRRR